jgi:ribokinase
MRCPPVVVIGSLNIDYIASVERLPAPGETVPAIGLIQRFGGKGANQAVAAARQGAAVSMIGCVGADDNGRAYRQRLIAEGINVRGFSTTTQALTGTALIAVDRAAENMIIVAPGANGHLGPSAIREFSPLISSSAALLLQFEVPVKTIIEAVKLANRARVPVALNPSPFRKGFPWGQARIHTLVTNELEAEAIFGMPTASVRSNSAVWLAALRKQQIEVLIITRGSKPTLCVHHDACLKVPGLKVKPVDTVGAGDAFAGTFVARRAEGLDLRTAIQHANCAGALATLKPGAQESIPTRAATDQAFRRLAI